jgi:uncharacterized membrane protein
MSDLIAVTYPDEHRAAEVLATLQRMHAEYLIDLADACYLTKDSRGRLKLHQSISLTGEGAKDGTAWGAVVGLLFSLPFVFVPGFGLAALATTAATTGVGAATGAIAGRFTDIGIDDNFAKQLGAKLQPSTSAILVLVKAAKVDEVLPEVSKYGGTVLRSTLAPDAEAKLQAALTAGAAAPPTSTGETTAQSSGAS